MRPTLRPAIPSDFAALGLDNPDYRVRAFTAVLGDEVIGLGGIAYLPGGTHGAFVHAKPGAHRYKMTFHKAGLAAIAEARRLGIKRLVAMAEPGVEPAVRWLKRLGFHDEITVDGQKVYAWQQ